jgi:translation initiation factor IF-3
VRLIDADGSQAGIVPIFDALKKAEDAELDLVEISPNAAPPVCRIMNYGKFIYEQSKQKAGQKKSKMDTKEVKFSPRTDTGDIEVKLRNLRRFLEQGHKAKVALRFRGREITHMELGMKLMEKLRADLELYGTLEQAPKLEGRQIVMMFAPKKKEK